MMTSAIEKIRNLDYTIVFARNMYAMRRFYSDVMKFQFYGDPDPQWVMYKVGASLLALTERGFIFDDAPPPEGALSVHLAFRVSPSEVDACAAELEAAGVALVAPPSDKPWGHRVVWFRDPDGNILEIYADIA